MDGGGKSRAAATRRLRRRVGVALAVIPVACAAGCGFFDGDTRTDDGGRPRTDAAARDAAALDADVPVEPPVLPELRPSEVIGVAVATVTPEVGGSVELGGAVLRVGPGVVAETVQLGLAEMTVPPVDLPEDDGALAGSVVLSTSAFLLTSDRDVTLAGPIELTLPIDPSRVPADADPSRARVAGVFGGFVLPQEPPAELDLAGGTMRLMLAPPSLARNAESMTARGAPRGAGISFVALSGALLAGAVGTFLGSQVIPFAAMLDQPWFVETLESEHFYVRYRADQTSRAEALRIGDILENAHALYSGLGFELPNFLGSVAGRRYTVVLDRFVNIGALTASHALAGGEEPDGFTIPGSGLVGGITYVNLDRPAADQDMAAAHEYFHAIQYGAIESVFYVNAFQRAIRPESDWLFEGAATALSGRVVLGGGTSAARDPTTATHLAQGRSCWDPRQEPAADVAQDLFYFMERELGDADLYHPMFAGLAVEGISGVESAVASVDATLRADARRWSGLADLWMDFIPDLTHASPAEYGGAPLSAATIVVTEDGVSSVFRSGLPPLSYLVLEIQVPPAGAGPARRDLSIEVAIPSSDTRIYSALSMPDGTHVPLIVARPSRPRVEVLPGLRDARTTILRLVLANADIERSAGTEVTLTVALTGEAVGPDAGVDAGGEPTCNVTPGTENTIPCPRFVRASGEVPRVNYCAPIFGMSTGPGSRCGYTNATEYHDFWVYWHEAEHADLPWDCAAEDPSIIARSAGRRALVQYSDGPHDGPALAVAMTLLASVEGRAIACP